MSAGTRLSDAEVATNAVRLAKAIDSILPRVDSANTTLRDIRTLVADALGVAPESFTAAQRAEIKDKATAFFSEQGGKAHKKVAKTVPRVSGRPQKRTKSENATNDDERLKALRALAQAMGTGPSVFRGLGDNVDLKERVLVLKERLLSRGASFKGDAPTVADIAKARKTREKQQDLDGIDASNILATGDRKRRRKSW